ncbi:MAG: ATP-binding protein [Pseudomonadota bacterium]
MQLTRHFRRFLQKILPAVSVLVLLFAALYLAGNATTGLSELGDLYVPIFALTGLAILVLVVAIAHRVYRLVVQLRSGAAGSRLTFRLVVLFVALAVPPASIVYWFSVDFLSGSIDRWFDVDVETALDDALDIGQSFLAVQERSARRQVQRVASELSDLPDGQLIGSMTRLLDQFGAREITVFEENGRVVRTVNEELGQIFPDAPQNLDLIQARQRGSYVDAEPLDDGGLQIRALAEIPERSLSGDVRIVQAIFPVTPGFDDQAANVERQLDRYRMLAFLRADLKRSVVFVLSLVLLLSVLLAVLLAFNTARRLVMPIGRLAEATRAVAAGDYGRRIDGGGQDELGFLVESFNTMTGDIEAASRDAQLNRREAEQRRDYLEAVLGRLSSAVLSLDAERRILTANAAADAVLGVRLEDWIGEPIDALITEHPALGPLLHHIEDHGGEVTPWREELTVDVPGQSRTLVCRGAPLTTEGNVGQVLVIDDVTDLVEAQRAAAWGEVARRLAHEVKNPLTPIQLAAERIRRRYLPAEPDDDHAVLDRGTRTIVSQVEALKTMVNAFSEYARAPTLKLEPVSLATTVDEVLDLYRGGGGFSCHSDWMAGEPRVLVDRDRIRQLLHNLIKNSREAVVDGTLELHVDTRLEWRGASPWLILSLRDNGPGIPDQVLDKLFEPYATTKDRGTGIGLAIVKKIAEEHGGEIGARNASGGGAIFELRLPVDAAELGSQRPPASVA